MQTYVFAKATSQGVSANLCAAVPALERGGHGHRDQPVLICGAAR